MAEFKEELVINALHPEKAEVGKKYWYSDILSVLKKYVEGNSINFNGKLTRLEVNDSYPFYVDASDGCSSWQYLYPYEEPPKQRMTNIQLMEWLSKGNGVYKNIGGYIHNSHVERYEKLDKEVDEGLLIKSWESEEWIEPTVDIYERDCQHTDNIL